MRAVVGEDIIITMMIMIIVRERDRGPDQDTEKTDMNMMTTREVEGETIPRMRMITELLRSCLISPDINLNSTGFSSERRILLSKEAKSTRSSGNILPSIRL